MNKLGRRLVVQGPHAGAAFGLERLKRIPLSPMSEFGLCHPMVGFKREHAVLYI